MARHLTTKVEKDPRIYLVGYDPSASTFVANRADGAATKIDGILRDSPPMTAFLTLELLFADHLHQKLERKFKSIQLKSASLSLV